MYIIHLAAEFSPIAKAGGLGDVTSGLSKALIKKGAEIEVILPFYAHIDREKLKGLTLQFEVCSSNGGRRKCKSRIWGARVNSIPILLIESENDYFSRGVIYGERDDDMRFIYFTHIAMECLLQRDRYLDVLHLHDWHVALAAPLYYEKYRFLGLKIGGIVTTIHNMQYQGVCDPKVLYEIGFSPHSSLIRDRLQDHKKSNKINPLRGALEYSDWITTVSPSYAKEIIKEEGGFGLSSILEKRKRRLKGILNGIDTHYWNPETDLYLKKNYSKQLPINKVCNAKKENRNILNNRVKIESKDFCPLFICVTRLVHQKGPERIQFGLEYILKKGGQFILLASAFERGLKKEFYSLKEKYKNNPHVHFHFAFDEELAHLAFAAADSIFIPSLFEPCGLTPMIALCYGTLPVVHKVGGLQDSVFDIDHSHHLMDQRNGYAFDLLSNSSVRDSVDRVFECYRNNPSKWRSMISNGFRKDWSWSTSSIEYLKIYGEISNSGLAL